MNLQIMKYFLLVSQERSISRGAAKAHVSQSALSQMIQKFEEDVGQPLFDRSNRGVTLTEAGEVVRKYATSIIKKYDQMLESLATVSGGQPKIRINGTFSMAAYSLPCLLYKLKKNFPHYMYELDARPTEDILRDVREGLTDFGFVDSIEPASTDDDLRFYPMGREHIVLIAPAGHPVPDSIELQELFDFEMILCTMSKSTCERLDQEFTRLGKDMHSLNTIFNADSLSAVKSSVVNGFGLAFVPYESIKHELYDKLIRLVAVNGLDMDYDIFMVTRQSRELNRSVHQILDYLLEAGVSIFC
jgi:DNA-binding transcriptional LysR family regulator